MRGMLPPTIDQTEGVWITRTNDQGYHLIQAVFPRNTDVDRVHRSNCRLLIQRGVLQPEHADRVPPVRREWNENERYCRDPI